MQQRLFQREELLFRKGGFMMDEKTITPVPVNKRSNIPWAGLGIMFTAFAFIVLIAAFSFSFYRISFLSKQLENAQLQLQSRMTGLQSTVETVSQASQQAGEDMKRAVIELRQSENADKDAWRVIQAQYYVKLASANLQFENNLPVAIQLLQTADHEIRDLNNPKLDPLRKSLTDDIATLQAVSQVDYTGLYLQLSSLDSQIDKLPLLTRSIESNIATSSVDNNQTWWRRGLDESWRALQKVVVIRYQATGVPPLVTPEQQDFLLQNVHGMLQRAMWALLNKNEDIYRVSLKQASEWIEKYFVTNAAVTQSVLANLNQLQQINIHPDAPKTIASAQVFHDYFNESSSH
jgi:uroporphyrin-3 C-methyltransferase